jgi:hypothetical protein
VRTSDLDLLARHVDEPTELYRIVKGASRGAPDVLDSLRSTYERDAKPRGVEVESVLIHFGLSMFVTFDAAAARAVRWPALGSHIATVSLETGRGFHIAETGARVHRTVWGRPLQILACIADILPAGAIQMDYSLFSSTGNLIDSFDDEAEARAALQRIVEAESEAAEDVAMFISEDEGAVVEGPIHAVPAHAR